MKEQETYAAIQKLAEQFVESKGYTSETFKDTDFGNDIEEEVCEYLDSIKDKINPDYWTAYPGKTNQFGYAQFILRDLSETGNSEDFEAFTNIRANISDYIVKLSNEVTTGSATSEAASVSPLAEIWSWIKSLLTIKTGRAITGNIIRNLTGF